MLPSLFWVIQNWRVSPTTRIDYGAIPFMLKIFTVLSQVISSDIVNWKPRVADIRSSAHNLSHLDSESEKLCDRISAAMNRWSSVYRVVPVRVAAIADFVMADDSFRLGVDDLLSQLVDIRKELRAVDASRSQSVVPDRIELLAQLKVWHQPQSVSQCSCCHFTC